MPGILHALCSTMSTLKLRQYSNNGSYICSQVSTLSDDDISGLLSTLQGMFIWYGSIHVFKCLLLAIPSLTCLSTTLTQHPGWRAEMDSSLFPSTCSNSPDTYLPRRRLQSFDHSIMPSHCVNLPPHLQGFWHVRPLRFDLDILLHINQVTSHHCDWSCFNCMTQSPVHI